MMMRKQITAKTTPTIIGVLDPVLWGPTWEYDKCYYIIKHVPDEDKTVMYLKFLSK